MGETNKEVTLTNLGSTCHQSVRGESHAVIICISQLVTYLDFGSIRSLLLFKHILQISSYIFRNIEHNIGDQQL